MYTKCGKLFQTDVTKVNNRNFITLAQLSGHYVKIIHQVSQFQTIPHGMGYMEIHTHLFLEEEDGFQEYPVHLFHHPSNPAL